MGCWTANTTVGLIVAVLSSAAHAAKLEEVAPFPKPESGFTRQVIHLTPQAREDDYQVEILAGKTLNVDCNRQAWAAFSKRKTLRVGAIRSTAWKKSSAR
nr:ecotin family protein [Klebsiella michiganensis]